MQSIKGILDRVRAEFVEMPGLRLTEQQVQRLCGVEAHVCRAVLESLVEAKFLHANTDGTYARFRAEPMVRPQPARVSVDRALEHGSAHSGRRTA